MVRRLSVPVGGDDELRVGECPHEVGEDALLPLRMQVEFDFVDEDNGFGLEWGVHVRVALRPAPGQVRRESEYDAISTAQ